MQRLLVGAALLYCATAPPGNFMAAPYLVGALAGIFLIFGLWTPVAGMLGAGAQVWTAYSIPAHPAIPAALAVLSVTLALIGPGEWSVDARLYGRKHIVPHRQ